MEVNVPKRATDATRTDAICISASIYRNDCADEERFTVPVGDTFRKCPSCRKAVGWKLAVTI